MPVLLPRAIDVFGLRAQLGPKDHLPQNEILPRELPKHDAVERNGLGAVAMIVVTLVALLKVAATHHHHSR
jgi:hypothetical protein